MSFPFFCGASLLRFLYLHCALPLVADLRVPQPHVIWRPPKNTLQCTTYVAKNFWPRIAVTKTMGEGFICRVENTMTCLVYIEHFIFLPPPLAFLPTTTPLHQQRLLGFRETRKREAKRCEDSSYSSCLTLGSALCIPLTLPPLPPSDFR